MSKATIKGERKKIKGRIIRIISERTVVINLGRDNGIQNNSVFYILGEPEKVIDPVTKEELGAVAVNKARVTASQVFEKFTIATTPLSYPDLSGLLTPNVELPVDPEHIRPWIATTKSPIRVGDEVEVSVITEPASTISDSEE